MIEFLRKPLKYCLRPIAHIAVKAGFSANMITITGTIATSIIALLTGFTGWLLFGGVLLIFAVLFDALDGSVAQIVNKHNNNASVFGAFLDSTCDRIADFFLFMGILLYSILHSDSTVLLPFLSIAVNIHMWIIILLCLYDILIAFLTSYTRARADSLGYDAKEGMATRSDRITIIIAGMILTAITHFNIVLILALLILAVLGTLTVYQRIHSAYIHFSK